MLRFRDQRPILDPNDVVLGQISLAFFASANLLGLTRHGDLYLLHERLGLKSSPPQPETIEVEVRCARNPAGYLQVSEVGLLHVKKENTLLMAAFQLGGSSNDSTNLWWKIWSVGNGETINFIVSSCEDVTLKCVQPTDVFLCIQLGRNVS